MAQETFTIIDGGITAAVPASINAGAVWLSPGALREALGWELKPEGLCKDDVCVPVHDGSGVLVDSQVNIEAFAALIERPIAIDVEEGAACLTAPAGERAAKLRSLEPPDFTLPDLDGHMHSLSDYQGKKVFLSVWASW